MIHVTETVLKKVTGKNAFAGEVSAPSVKATKIEVPFTLVYKAVFGRSFK